MDKNARRHLRELRNRRTQDHLNELLHRSLDKLAAEFGEQDPGLDEE